MALSGNRFRTGLAACRASPSMLLNKRRTPFGWSENITKKLLHVAWDGASYQHALRPQKSRGRGVNLPPKPSPARKNGPVRAKVSFTGFAPDLLRHKSVFQVSRTVTHKSVPNGASHLTRSTEDEVRRAPWTGVAQDSRWQNRLMQASTIGRNREPVRFVFPHCGMERPLTP